MSDRQTTACISCARSAHASDLDGELMPIATVRPAEDKWGCAYERCLEKAQVVVTTAKGEFGACGKHVKAVRSFAR